MRQTTKTHSFLALYFTSARFLAVTCSAAPAALAGLINLVVAETASAQPAPAEWAARVRKIDAQIDAKFAHLDIVARTENPRGSFVWVRKDSQKLPRGMTDHDSFPAAVQAMRNEKGKVLSREGQEAVAALKADMKGPPGTVPLYRHKAEHVAKTHSDYSEYLRSLPKPASQCLPSGQCRYWSDVRENAQSFTRMFSSYGSINIWQPAVDLVNNADPMSLMQVGWGANGTDGQVESLEVGWQVNPVGYNGDTATHLFSFLTNDGYTSSFCYNQDCVNVAGFYVASTWLTPGVSLTPSTLALDRDLPIEIYWYDFDYYIYVLGQEYGAVPGTYYETAGLQYGGSWVAWYGEVSDNSKDGIATTTDMGNGMVNYAYIRQMEVVSGDTGPNFRHLVSSGVTITDSNCYDGQHQDFFDGYYDSSMWLGGPGQSATCTSD